MSLHILPIPRLNKPKSLDLFSQVMFSGPLIILVVHLWILANWYRHFSNCYLPLAGHSIPDEALFIWQRKITSHTLYSTPPFIEPVQGFLSCSRINLLTHIQIPFCRSAAYSLVQHLVFVPLTIPIKV